MYLNDRRSEKNTRKNRLRQQRPGGEAVYSYARKKLCIMLLILAHCIRQVHADLVGERIFH